MDMDGPSPETPRTYRNPMGTNYVAEIIRRVDYMESLGIADVDEKGKPCVFLTRYDIECRKQIDAEAQKDDGWKTAYKRFWNRRTQACVRVPHAVDAGALSRDESDEELVSWVVASSMWKICGSNPHHLFVNRGRT